MAPQQVFAPLESDVLRTLGLSHSPFAAVGEEAFSFCDAANKTQLNVALQLLQASDRLLVVRGDAGMGKSAFLRGLVTRDSPGSKFCLLTANPDLDFEELLGRFLRETELLGPDEAVSVTLAAAWLVDSTRAGQRPVLVIDDAHELNPEVLARIVSLRADTAAEGAPFGLVLGAEPSLDARIEELKKTVLSPEQLHTINLYPLSEKQTADYLGQQIALAGGLDDLLSDGDRREIYNSSRGIPARIGAEAVRVLTEKAGGGKRRKPVAEPAAAEPSARKPLLRRPAVLAGVAVGVLCGALLVGLQVAERQPAADPKAAPYGLKPVARKEAPTPVVAAPPGLPAAEPAPALAPAPGLPVTASAPPQAEGSAATAETQPAAVAEAAQPATPAEAAPAPAAVAEPAPVAPTPAPAVAAAPAPAPEPARPAEPTPRPQPAVAAAPAPAAGGESAEGRRYTVQLLGASELASVEKYVRDHALRDQLEVRRTLRDGKDWYVVVSGDYDSAKTALAALKKLPPTMRASGPFVRRLDNLEAAIEQ